jgi:methionine-rich copper-binding protein CopC
MFRTIKTAFVVIFLGGMLAGGYLMGKGYLDNNNYLSAVQGANTEKPQPTDDNLVITPTADLIKAKQSPSMKTYSPVHGAHMTERPKQIVIEFSRELEVGSAIYIMNQKDYSFGPTEVGESKLIMTQKVNQDIPYGLITVNYTACWKDRSCDQATYEFYLDKPEVSLPSSL